MNDKMINDLICHNECYFLIDNTKIIKLISLLQHIVFPNYFEKIETTQYDYLKNKLNLLKEVLISLLSNIIPTDQKETITNLFIEKIIDVKQLLQQDVEAIFNGDPAASSLIEIVLCYPGFFAILIHRFAHELFILNIPFLPRMMSEYAHEKTGIDIHPGATIGHSFCIDHGTGIVIGETCTIGNFVKIYQGVTLGAISLKKGQELKAIKRHPTIEDHVTIYAGASILGGNTIIGKNSVIGGNVFITSSIPSDTTVIIKTTNIINTKKSSKR